MQDQKELKEVNNSDQNGRGREDMIERVRVKE